MGQSGNPAKRAAQDAPKTYDPTPVDDDGVEDFDAFWETQERKSKPVRIMGEVIQLPPALPLQFELEAQRLGSSDSDDDVRKCVAILFGADMLERWAERGMDTEMFRVLLAWAPQRISGGTVSIPEVAARLRESEGESDPT